MSDPTDGLKVLLEEQKHVDKEIESMMGLQMKVLGLLFPALAAAAGWIFKTRAEQAHGPQIVLIFIVLICFGILLSVICHGLSAEYARYKSEVLGPRIQRLLGGENLLDGSKFGSGKHSYPLIVALIGLWTTVSAALCIALVVATSLIRECTQFTLRFSLYLAYGVSLLSLFSVVFSFRQGLRGPLSKK